MQEVHNGDSCVFRLDVDDFPVAGEMLNWVEFRWKSGDAGEIVLCA